MGFRTNLKVDTFVEYSYSGVSCIHYYPYPNQVVYDLQGVPCLDSLVYQ